MSMDFTASRFDPAERMYSWVFPKEWMHRGEWDDNDVFTENPEYRPDLNLNLSNGNMIDVLGALGYHVDERDGTFDAPIDEFIARATAWLRNAIGKQSAEEPDRVERSARGGELDLTLLKPRKYEEFKAAELANEDVLATVRRVWDRLEKSNSVLPGQTWDTFRDKWIEKRAKTALDRWEADEKAKHQSFGPTIVHVGKAAGYYNERINRMVRIAREGKAMGATHVTAA